MKHDIHIASKFNSEHIDFDTIPGFKIKHNQSRPRLRFVHRHKLKNPTRIWQLGDNEKLVFDSVLRGGEGNGGGVLDIAKALGRSAPRMTERVPSA